MLLSGACRQPRRGSLRAPARVLHSIRRMPVGGTGDQGPMIGRTREMVEHNHMVC